MNIARSLSACTEATCKTRDLQVQPRHVLGQCRKRYPCSHKRSDRPDRTPRMRPDMRPPAQSCKCGSRALCAKPGSLQSFVSGSCASARTPSSVWQSPRWQSLRMHRRPAASGHMGAVLQLESVRLVPRAHGMIASRMVLLQWPQRHHSRLQQLAGFTAAPGLQTPEFRNAQVHGLNAGLALAHRLCGAVLLVADRHSARSSQPEVLQLDRSKQDKSW